MASILPHSAQIRADVAAYLNNASTLVNAALNDLKNSGDYKAIYKITLSADAVLSKLGVELRPSCSVSRNILQRIPVLVALAQTSAAQVELRRLIEVVFWTVYFSDHPIEWNSFEENPTAGIEVDPERPISYNAHRMPSYYRKYAIELFAKEPYGLAKQAANELATQYGNLSVDVHAAAGSTTKQLSPAFDAADKKKITDFMKTQRIVFSASCLVLCAYDRHHFDRLPAVHRAWFDWLIGSTKAKALRSGRFGL